MPKRTICINSAATIYSSANNLVVKNKNGTARIPFEDIWVLIVESKQASISTSALSDLCQAGIGTMLCDSSHMPNGLLLPLGAHSRHAAIVEDQLLISKPLKKRMWQAIVRKKIENQAEVLKHVRSPESKTLINMSKKVLSGDTDGREAAAAATYFKILAPKGGRRNSDLTPLLDYGYAILRAGIARSAVGGGWLVSRGIHHCNNLNAFNLVDDLIEPFRPVIDLIVVKKLQGQTLTKNAKTTLIEAFEYYVSVEGEIFTVQNAIDELLDSFKRAVLDNDANLLRLPTVIPLKKWNGEEQ